jgi:hypothetical protein
VGGLTKRRLYKPERSPARKRGIFGKHSVHKLAPVSCPDANEGEVAKALYAVAREAGVIIGQGSGYDALRDEYTVIGKSMATGKAQDFTIAGAEIGVCIKLARMLNGGQMRPGANPR